MYTGDDVTIMTRVGDVIYLVKRSLSAVVETSDESDETGSSAPEQGVSVGASPDTSDGASISVLPEESDDGSIDFDNFPIRTKTLPLYCSQELPSSEPDIPGTSKSEPGKGEEKSSHSSIDVLDDDEEEGGGAACEEPPVNTSQADATKAPTKQCASTSNADEAGYSPVVFNLDDPDELRDFVARLTALELDETNNSAIQDSSPAHFNDD